MCLCIGNTEAETIRGREQRSGTSSRDLKAKFIRDGNEYKVEGKREKDPEA